MTKLKLGCTKDDRFTYRCDTLQEEINSAIIELKRVQAELAEVKCRYRWLEAENHRRIFAIHDRDRQICELNELIGKISIERDVARTVNMEALAKVGPGYIVTKVGPGYIVTTVDEMTKERDRAISEKEKIYSRLENEVASRVRVDRELRQTKLELYRVVKGIRSVIGDGGNNKEEMDATEKR
jgi:hypothetical protein